MLRSGSRAAKIGTKDTKIATRADDGYDAAVVSFGGSIFFALLLVGAGVVLAPKPVSALPSFARQTGQPCATCHTAFPQLTPYGRQFKLLGYTAGGTRCGDVASSDQVSALLQIPIAGMTVPSFTHLNKPLDPADTPKGFKTNDNTFVQESSLFYGGQVYCNLGAFVQATYERPGASFFLDNADIRYAGKTKLGGTDLVFGVTANNNPTVQDPWNTTPAWSFPFIGASDALAPTPAASTIIEGTFAGRVGGTGVYIFANNSFYLEGTAYGTFDTQTLQALGLDPADPPSRFDGLAPYWRAAYEKDWGYSSLMLGTFGMFANIAPLGNQSGPIDHVSDVGFDAQYQYIRDVHAFTARFGYIFENANLNGSQPLGLSAHSSDDLQSLKISGSYVYNGTVSFTAGYFDISGSADPILYADSLSPSALGSPNSNGWVFDVAWLPFSNGGPALWPWLNARLGVSYTLYDQFDGASNNYNGAFRNARDNNTTFLYAWLAF